MDAIKTLIILESELDAIIVSQEVEKSSFCLVLGGSSQPLDIHEEREVRGGSK